MNQNISWEFGDLEEKILNVAMFDSNFFLIAIEYLKSEYFENPIIGKLIKIFKKFYAKYKYRPTKEIFLTISKKIFKDDLEELQIVLDKIEFIYNKNSTNVNEKDFIINEIDNFLKKNKLKSAILKSVDYLNKGEFDSISTEIENAVKFTTKISDFTEISRDIENRYMQLVSNESVIPSFFQSLNLKSGGGMRRGEIAIVMAGSGVGKSTFLINQAVWSLKKDYNVLYVSLELSKEEISFRIDRNLFQKTPEELKDDWIDLPQKYEEFYKEHSGRLFIHTGIATKFTSNDLQRVIDDLKIYEKFVPDIILFDYLELGEANDNYNRKKNEYDRQGIITKELRAIAKKNNVVMLTATQANRKVDNLYQTEEPLSENQVIGDSIKKLQDSDQFFLVLQTKEEAADKKGRFVVMKNRHGERFFMFKINIEFAKMLMTEQQF